MYQDLAKVIADAGAILAHPVEILDEVTSVRADIADAIESTLCKQVAMPPNHSA